jgi:hypothetical protein
VSAGLGGEERSIREGEGHGWKFGTSHEVVKRGEDRLPKEDMRSTGIGEDGIRGDRTQQRIMVRVLVGIVRFQRGEGVGGKKRDTGEERTIVGRRGKVA